MVSVGQEYGKGLTREFLLGVSMQWQPDSGWSWDRGEGRGLEQLAASRAAVSPPELSIALLDYLSFLTAWHSEHSDC